MVSDCLISQHSLRWPLESAIALARFSSAFSRFNRFSSADSSVVLPGRWPASTSACRHHFRIVSGIPTPSRSATFVIAAHSDSWSARISTTIRTARSRSSARYLFDVLPDMTHPSQGTESPDLPGRFTPLGALTMA